MGALGVSTSEPNCIHFQMNICAIVLYLWLSYTSEYGLVVLLGHLWSLLVILKPFLIFQWQLNQQVLLNSFSQNPL